jgi:hypothetical protein
VHGTFLSPRVQPVGVTLITVGGTLRCSPMIRKA